MAEEQAGSLLKNTPPDGEDAGGAEESGNPEAQDRSSNQGDKPDDTLILGKYKDVDALAEAYKNLEGKIGKKDEELRAAIKEELVKEQFGNRPSAPGEYQLPENLDIDPEQAGTNEMLTWWSETAFEKGLSQEEFAAGIEVYKKNFESAIPQGPDLEAEEKKLGDNASARIEAASNFAHKNVPKEHLGAIERMFQTADGIMAMEALMESMKGNSVGGDDDIFGGEKVTEESVREMMKDERYMNPVKRDKDFVNRVNQAWKRLYPD